MAVASPWTDEGRSFLRWHGQPAPIHRGPAPSNAFCFLNPDSPISGVLRSDLNPGSCLPSTAYCLLPPMTRPDYWLTKFSELRIDRARGDPAPHKPLLLLVLCDLVEKELG
jgi:hypothetical protein